MTTSSQWICKIFDLVNAKAKTSINKKNALRYNIQGLEFYLYSENRFKNILHNYLSKYLHEEVYTNQKQFFFFTLSDFNLFNEIESHLSDFSGVMVEVFKDLFFFKFEEVEYSIFVPVNLSEYPFIILKRNNEIFIIGNQFHSLFLRYPLRIMREIIIRESENAGSILFHASSVEIEGKGILIPGSKGAGKTSLMSYLLCRKRTNFLNNDRVFLTLEDHLCYLPLPIRFSYETLKAINHLVDIKNQKLSGVKKEIKESVSKIEMTPEELCITFSTKKISKSSLHLILFPSFDRRSSKCTVDLMQPKEAKIILKNVCGTPYDENWTNPWLIKRTKSNLELESDAEKRIEQMISKKPMYKVTFGPQTNPEDVLTTLNKTCFV